MSAFIRLIGVGCLLWLALSPARADCPPGTIALVKKNVYDWPASYKGLLARQFPVAPLNRYFFTGNGPRECVSLAELQQLSIDVNRVLGNSRDQKAKAFLAAIQRVSDQNKPTPGVALPGPGLVTDSVQTKSRMPNGADTIDPQATLPVSEVVDAAQQTDLPSGKSPIGLLIGFLALGALGGTLLGGALVYFRFYQRAKLEAADLRNQNAVLSRQIDESRRKSPPVASVRPNTDHFPAPRPQQKGWVDEEPTPTPTPQTEPEPAIVVEPGLTMPTLTDTMPSVIPIMAPPVNRSDLFYLPPPNPDGAFDTIQQSPVLTPESAYIFSTKSRKPEQATFKFDAEPGRIARLMTYRNYFIDPACDSENTFSEGHTRIKTLRDGTATLDNGVWRVTGKALIRYE